MKSKNLITAVALLFILVASSCSQARYGHLTKRVKVNHLAKQEVKETKKEINTTQVEVAESNEVIEKDQFSAATEVVNEVIVTVEPVIQETVVEAINLPAVVSSNSEVVNMVVPEPTTKNKRIARAKKKLENKIETSVEEAQDELLRTVLIIILILIILGLVISLLPPPLSTILSVLVAVLLILYIIKLLA